MKSIVNSLVVFNLENQHYALPLSAVERVIRAAAITLLPKAPDIVLGVINIQGRIIPLFNIRKRFNLPQRDMGLSDQFIVAHISTRPVGLVVDSVTGVDEYSDAALIPAKEILPGLEYVDGVVKLPDGLVLIHDLETFLSLDERRSLDQAMQQV